MPSAAASAVPDAAHHNYNPLVNESREIRILRILPGSWLDPIHCKMMTVSLDHDPLYTALSYVWGDVKVTDTIFIDAQPFQATMNLVAALRQFRALKQPRAYWIDAICINQADLVERNHQVKLMRDIYQGSQATFVWLGTASGYTRGDPFELLRHFSNNMHWHDIPGFSRSAKEGQQRQLTTMEFNTLWDGLRDFAENPWWTRVWTVQEVVLPRSVYFLLGPWWVHLSDATPAFEYQFTHATSCCRESYSSLPDSCRDVLMKLGSHLLIARSFRSTINNNAHRGFGNLDNIFRSYQNRKCYDPTDRVYGFLGLIQMPPDATFAPDYNLTHWNVYINTARGLLESENGQTLSLTGLGFHLRSHELWLPSWVRDFSAEFNERTIYYDRCRFGQRDVYHAAGQRKAEIRFCRDGLDLIMHGKRVGSIRKQLHRPDPNITLTLLSWRRQIEDPATHDRASSASAKVQGNDSSASEIWGEDLQLPAFWRTVTGQCLDQSSPTYEAFEWARLSQDALDYLVHNGLTIWQALDKLTVEETYKYYAAVEVATTGRELFLSDSGRLGLCYPAAQSGDEIWVLYGSNVPFLLRPRSDSSRKEGTKLYQFIGDCFYDGVMFGEALKDPSLTEEELILR